MIIDKDEIYKSIRKPLSRKSNKIIVPKKGKGSKYSRKIKHKGL